MIISAWPLIKVCAQTQDQTNNAYCVILWSFFDKNGQIVSHQFYFFSWRATLVACIQNATDIVKGNIFCTEIKILNSESHEISQKLRKSKCLLFHFFSNKVDQNTIFAKLPSAKWLFLVWLYISAIKSWKVYT